MEEKHSNTCLTEAIILNISLSGMEVHKLRAEKKDAQVPVEKDLDFDLRLGVQMGRSDNALFGVRLIANIVSSVIDAEVVVAAFFKYSGDSVLTDKQATAYINEVGVMTLIPYLRSQVADLTQRILGMPLWIPIIPRGEIEVDIE